ncbi:MAG: ACP S-malonyltransferase [Chlamydiota bacterium]|nr:ACP S-malonyltransferase [Chlamydiota bacterium]
MQRIACLFPGQGSQYVGMGSELYETYPIIREVFDKAEQLTGIPLTRLCFKGPVEELNLTSISQPAIFVLSLACYRFVKSKIQNFIPDAVAGLSLGEFSALCAADAISFDEALGLVKARGEYMDMACRERPGKMASILGLDWKSVEALCKEIEHEYIVGVANVNNPSQIVISGEPNGIQKLIEMAKSKGAKKAIELRVQGAFHSPLMESAKQKLSAYIQSVHIVTPKIPFFSNVSGSSLSDPEQIRRALIDQVTGSVLWVSDVQGMLELGINCTLELGCGKVLTGFQRKIAPETVTLNIEDKKSFEYTMSQLSSLSS